MSEYSQKVSSIFKFGICEINQPWSNYMEKLSLSKEHIPELIEIIRKSDIELVSTGCSREECAPMHAWRALGQLEAIEAVKPLLEELIDEKNEEAFWYAIELPEVLGLIGPDSISIVKSFLDENYEVGWSYKIIAIRALVNIVLKNIQFRKPVIEMISDFLKEYEINCSAQNASLIKELSKLEAKEVSNLVMRVIAEDRIDFEFVSEEDIRKIVDRLD